MNETFFKSTTVRGAALLLGLSLGGIGCSTSGSSSAGGASKAAASSAANQSGARLWAQNCGHCHNIRSPGSYSDAQWDVAMLHMRVRANLTPGQAQKILDFLKSSS